MFWTKSLSKKVLTLSSSVGMKDKYILDSSIWIELERHNEAILRAVRPLIQKNRVCLADVIVAEVLRGTKTRKDFQTLKKAFQNFRWLHARWEEVADLGFRVAQKGYHPPLIDLYIAQCAMENRCILITQDRHFDPIAKAIPLKFEMLS